MTFTNQTNRTSAVGTGSTGQEIPFLFPVNATSDLTAYKLVTSTGVQTTLAETTNYTVVISGDDGGTVTTVTAIEATEQIHIVRNTPNTQELDLEQGGPFNAERVESAVDKNAKLGIENKDALERTLIFPATDPTSSFADMPSSIDRASKNLTFDSTGKPTASVAIEEGSVTHSDFGKTVAEAANAATARGLFELGTDDDVEFAGITGTTGTFDNVITDNVITKGPVFDVTHPDYGATGDGTTDDTAAIALADAAAALVSGGEVFFPAGTYLVTGTDSGDFRRGVIVTADNTTYRGVGRASIIKQSTSTGEAQFCFSDNGAADPVTNVRFTQLMFQGNGVVDVSSGASAAFRFQLFDGVEIDHCYFTDLRANFYGATGTTTVSTGLRFHDNEVYGGDARVSALGIKCQFAKEMWILDNKFQKVSRPLSIEIDSSASYTITDVWFCRNLITEGTLTTYAGISDTYEGCQITANNASNVLNNIHIIDNTFRGNAKGAGNTAYDILITGSGTAETTEGVIVRGNVFEDGTDLTQGIHILNAHRCLIDGNIFLNPSNSAGSAIRVRQLTGSTSGATNNIISNNIINGTNWGNAIQEDDIDAGTEFGNIFFNNHDTTLASSFANIGTTKSFVFQRGSSENWQWVVGGQSNTTFMTGDGMAIGGGTAISKHISATVAWNPGNLGDGASETKQITVTGAAVGDSVAVGFPMEVSATPETGNWLISGRVSATNTVQVTITNHTGGAKDLDSETLRVDVWQH